MDTCRRVDVAVCDDGMESLCPGGHASVTVLVGDGLFLKKELVYAACFARRPSLQVKDGASFLVWLTFKFHTYCLHPERHYATNLIIMGVTKG